MFCAEFHATEFRKTCDPYRFPSSNVGTAERRNGQFVVRVLEAFASVFRSLLERQYNPKKNIPKLNAYPRVEMLIRSVKQGFTDHRGSLYDSGGLFILEL